MTLPKDQLAELERWSAGVRNEELPVRTGAALEHTLPLRLRRVGDARPGQRAVLFLHGGNSGSDTFLMPDGGIAFYLARRGWDVWLLDWRGSPYTQKLLQGQPLMGPNVFEECRLFTYDRAAAEDIPAALKAIRAEIGEATPLSVVGHCASGGVVAIATALGLLDDMDVRRIVLVALGLFYRVPWDSRMKVEDFVLERVVANAPSCRGIDPLSREAWPDDMLKAYSAWPDAWLHRGSSDATRLLQSLTFMIGKPWSPERLAEGMHGDVLLRCFGPFHLGLYLHSAQMVRRGYAAPFDVPDVLDRASPALAAARSEGAPSADAHFLRPEPFQKAERITLIAGDQNGVWHRDSIDLMYEWLRGLGTGAGRSRYVKHVFPGHGLQELFWGAAASAVYAKIEEGL